MGLREDQKATRRNAILDAAARLYLARGFEAVRAEEIASEAGVSTATLYNYFGGKGDILMTLVTRETQAIVDATKGLVANPPRLAVEAYQAYFAAWFDPKAILLNQALWRQGIALSFTEVETEAAKAFRDADQDLLDQVITLTETLKAREALRGNVEVRLFATALFNNANMLFFDYSRSDDMTLETLRAALADTVAAVVAIAEPGRVTRG